MPINKESMQIFQVSKSSSQNNSRIAAIIVLGEKVVESKTSLTTNDRVGLNVCVKGGKVWVGYVHSFDEEFADFFVCFLHPSKMQKL